MSALDDLVQQLHAAVASTQTAQGDAAQAESSAGEAVHAAAAFGWDEDVQQVDVLRSEIEEQAGILAGTRQALDELLQRAVRSKVAAVAVDCRAVQDRQQLHTVPRLSRLVGTLRASELAPSFARHRRCRR